MTVLTHQKSISVQAWITVGLVVSTLGGWYHNRSEFPDMPVWAPEIVATIAPAAGLVVWWRVRPGRAVWLGTMIWLLLSLLIGGFLSVLPLPIFPFEPVQSVPHYQSHLAYAASQLPLLVFLIAVGRAGDLEWLDISYVNMT